MQRPKKSRDKIVPELADIWQALENRDTELVSVVDRVEQAKLTEREKDLAIRSSLEYRPYSEWAKYYQTSIRWVGDTLNKPAVKELVRELRRDVRSFMVSKSAALLQSAFTQYDEIFALETDAKTIESKRKAAADVLEFWKPQAQAAAGAGKSEESPAPESSASSVIDAELVSNLDDLIQSAKNEIKGLDALQLQITALEQEALITAPVQEVPDAGE